MSTTQSISSKTPPHLTLSLTTPTPHISLSSSPHTPILLLTVHAHRTSTPPITLCTASSPLDNGHHTRHDGPLNGAFLPLTSTTSPTRRIQLHFSGSPNYGSLSAAPANMLERDYLRFETIPSKCEGELAVTHEISLERLFRYSDLRKEDVKVGEKFRVRMNPKRMGSVEGWWCWGSLEGELKGKKFARWERPDWRGEIGNLMPGEGMPDVEGMEREGWVFSELFHQLRVEAGEDEEVIVEFVE